MNPDKIRLAHCTSGGPLPGLKPLGEKSEEPCDNLLTVVGTALVCSVCDLLPRPKP